MSVKIAAAVLCEIMIAALLRQYKPEFVPVSEAACGALVFFLLLGELLTVKSAFSSMLAQVGVRTEYVQALVKVLGTTLVTQFAADTARDNGEVALAGQLEFAGRVLCVAIALPLFKGLLQLIGTLGERIS